jgi:phosphate:Na+ symporter
MLQILIALAGAVSLLLWGTHMVQTGVQRAFGPRLRAFVGRALRNRACAFGAGLTVTAVLQSSTATGLIISGFVASGMVDLLPALAVMLGANVGTTLIVQLLSFDISAVTPALILIGVTLFRRYRTTGLRDIGRIFIGLGLMLLALHGLLQTMTPYEDAPALHALLAFVGTVPLLAVLASCVLTWLVHSSVAIVLVLMSLASKGAIAPDTAFAFVLGANLGTALNPVLEGAPGSDPAGKRLPVGNLLARVGGVLVALACLQPLTRMFVAIAPDLSHALADFHTAFNVAVALAFLPLLGAYQRLLVRLLPERVDPTDPSRPLYLAPGGAHAPVVALDAAAREALRLTEMLDAMLVWSGEGLAMGRRDGAAQNKRLGQSVRRLGEAIQTYLSRLDPDELDDADRQRLDAIFAFVSNIHCATNAAEMGLQRLVNSRWSRGLRIDAADRAYLDSVLGRLRGNVRTAASLLTSGDRAAAQLLADEKRTFRKLESQASRLHFDRLRADELDGSFRLDLVRELKHINAFLVAAAAYPALEPHGALPDRMLAQAV